MRQNSNGLFFTQSDFKTFVFVDGLESDSLRLFAHTLECGSRGSSFLRVVRLLIAAQVKERPTALNYFTASSKFNFQVAIQSEDK